MVLENILITDKAWWKCHCRSVCFLTTLERETLSTRLRQGGACMLGHPVGLCTWTAEYGLPGLPGFFPDKPALSDAATAGGGRGEGRR